MSKELLCIHCGEEIDEFAANPSKWNAEHLYHWGCVQLYAEEFAKGLLLFMEKAGGNNFKNKHETIINEYKATL